MARLYDPLSLHDLPAVLSRHEVRWVVSGAEEVEAYGEGHLALFRAFPGLLVPAFESGGVTLYRVPLRGRYETEHFISSTPPPQTGFDSTTD